MSRVANPITPAIACPTNERKAMAPLIIPKMKSSMIKAILAEPQRDYMYHRLVCHPLKYDNQD